MNPHIAQLQLQLEPARKRLLSHPVYQTISDLAGIQEFTRIHVFAVWDFMSLLKSLQLELTSVAVPWMPRGSADTRYLINEIVTGEESDVDEAGNRTSHFELYLKAMKQLGADSSPIEALLANIQTGLSVGDAIAQSDLPENVKKFLQYTFAIAVDAPLHIKAAVFTFGREDLIPSMFHELLLQLHAAMPEKISVFRYYIERHIEVDGGHHSHLALQMVSELCGADEEKWREAGLAAQKALEMRYLLWDAVSAAVLLQEPDSTLTAFN